MEHTIYKDPNDSERNGIIYGDIELENLDRPSMESINSYEMDRPSMDLERPSIESINSYTDNGTKLIDSPKKDEHVKKHGLGVVLGVMIPVYSTTFEIILFLRQPFVVGQAGVWLASLMFLLGYIAIWMTTLSVSAIVSNGRVKGGGTYFMISRILGPGFGGAIGLIYYFGNLTSAALYIIGFVELFLSAVPGAMIKDSMYWSTVVYASTLLAILVFITIVGVWLFSKLWIFTFMILVSSIIHLFVSYAFQKPNLEIGYTGWSAETLYGNFYPKWTVDPADPSVTHTFGSAFGILFPALCGMMGGVNLSGDLKEPHKSLPFGTLFATITAYFIYTFFNFLFASTTKSEALVSNFTISADVSFIYVMFVVSVCTNSTVTALSNIIGASRILQAVARDGLVPKMNFLGKGFGYNDEPRIATVVTWILVQILIFIGQLNAVAPLFTVFEVINYSLLNFACFAMIFTNSVNFRPRFRFYSWATALLGVISAVTIAFTVNAVISGITYGVLLILAIIITYFAPPESKKWGSVSNPIIYQQLLRLHRSLTPDEEHVKFWYLRALVLVSNVKQNYQLLHFADNLASKGGLLMIGHVKIGEFENEIDSYEQDAKAFKAFFKEEKLKAFLNMVISKDKIQGVLALLTTSNLGMIQSNTVILEFPNEPTVSKTIKHSKSMELFSKMSNSLQFDDEEFLQISQYILSLRKNLVIARHFPNLDKSLWKSNIIRNILKKDFYIDIWLLHGSECHDDIFEPTVSLTLQMGALINRVYSWSLFHTMRVITIIDNAKYYEEEKNRLKNLLATARIKAQALVVVMDPEDLQEIKNSRTEVSTVTIDVEGKSSEISVVKSESLNFTKELSVKNVAPIMGDMNVPLSHLTQREQSELINSIIKSVSVKNKTSLVFLTMPPFENSKEYMDNLDILTRDLQPTLLVHGHENVISTDL